MLRVGIVAEGNTDWIVLEEVMKTVHADIESFRLHPNLTLNSYLGQGWRGVQAWCVENGPQLELLMNADPSRPLHVLVVHADCSMADKVGEERLCPPASETAQALTKVIETEWLCRDPRPEFVLIATPSKSSDAWVVAALDPPYANLSDVECDFLVEREFRRRKLLERKSDGGVRKQPWRYAPIAARIGPAIETVCTHCPQAEAFRSSFRNAVARTLPP